MRRFLLVCGAVFISFAGGLFVGKSVTDEAQQNEIARLKGEYNEAKRRFENLESTIEAARKTGGKLPAAHAKPAPLPPPLPPPKQPILLQ